MKRITLAIILVIIGPVVDSRHVLGRALSFDLVERDEMVAVLDICIAQIEANYSRIQTWKGSCTVRDKSLIDGDLALHYLRGAESPVKLPMYEIVTASASFVVDMRSDSCFCELRPTSFEVVSAIDGAVLTNPNFKKAPRSNVATPEHRLHFSRELIYGPVGKRPDKSVIGKRLTGPMAFRDPAETARDETMGEIIDPRSLRGYSRPTDQQLLLYRNSLANPANPRVAEYMRTAFKVSKAETPKNTLFKVSVTDDVILEETVFDGEFGFNPVQWRQRRRKTDTGSFEMAWNYKTIQGIFVPAEIRISISADNDKSAFERIIEFHECVLNEPVNPSTFTFKQLGLADGDRVLDRIANALYVYQNGNLVSPTSEAKSKQETNFRLGLVMVTLTFVASICLLLVIRQRRRNQRNRIR